MPDDDLAIEVAFAREQVQEEALALLFDLMARHGYTKAELADEMGMHLSYLSVVLNGHRPVSLAFLVRALYALGYQLQLQVLPL